MGAAPIELTHRRDACFGVCASYALRRIAFRAGAYAPGIGEHAFFDLTTPRHGGTFDATRAWIESHLAILAAQGYRYGANWTGADESTLAAWVWAGRGRRGAILPAQQRLLYPDAVATLGDDHAVGLVVEPHGGSEELVMIDPWPEGGRLDRVVAPATLAQARRDLRPIALAVYWVGWS